MPNGNQSYRGEGKTLDEALKTAHAKIKKSDNVADETITSRVTQFGKRTGGFAGEDKCYVEVEQIDRQGK